MNCWKVLGIDATSDLTAIKSAYAAKAREWHPEEHPEEFRQLQQAYHSAVRFAKAQKKAGSFPAAAEQDHVAVSRREAAGERVTERPAEGAVENTEPVKAAAKKEEPARMAAEPPSQDFDYEEVGEADLKDRFFQEFFSIAWNPYLMNNLACWEYMLKRSSYERLLSSPAFRRNFVLTVCHQLMGWQRGTILFFEQWLQSRPADDADGTLKKETDLPCWRFRKIGLSGKLVPAQRCVTNEQKQLHEIFLAQVGHCGVDTSLTGRESVECYLSFYLPYAAGRQSKIKELYRAGCQGRTLFITLLLMLPLMIGMMLYVQLSVVPQLNGRAGNESGQQGIEQRADEIRRYNEPPGGGAGP